MTIRAPNGTMDAMNASKNRGIPPELLAELAEVLKNPYAAPDRELMANACAQLSRMREETRKQRASLMLLSI